MNPFIALLLQILPYLPAVLRTVEQMFPDKGQGVKKLQSAVALLSVVAPAVVDHLKAEPANKPKLESLINTVVAGLNAADSWKQGVDQVPAP